MINNITNYSKKFLVSQKNIFTRITGVVKIKKVLILVLLLIVLSGITMVSAADTNQTNNTLNTNSDSALNSENNNILNNTQTTNDDSASNKNITDSKASNSTKLESNSKTKTLMSVSNKTVNVTESITLISTLKDSSTGKYVATGLVCFKINGRTIGYANITNGKAYYTYSTSTLTGGTYTISAVYGGSSTLASASANGTLTVLKLNSKVTITSKTVNATSVVQLKSTVTNSKTGSNIGGGKVVFKINGVTIGYGDVKNGVATYNYNTSKIGSYNYTLTATYGGNGIYNKNSASGKLNVLIVKTEMSIGNATVYSNGSVVLTATLVNSYNRNYLTNGLVAFKINGITVGHANITNGKARYTYTATNLGSGTYTLTALYGGSSQYTSQQAKSTLNVLKSTINAKVTNITSSSNSVTLTATFTNTASNTQLTGGTVVFKLAGVTLGYSTIKNGKATYVYNATELCVDSYTISVTLGETNFYKKATATGTYKRTCQSTFNFTEIKDASVTVRNMYESNHILTSVKIASTKIYIQDYLALAMQLVLNINKNKANEAISYKHYKAASTNIDTISYGRLSESQISTLATNVLNYMKTNSQAPNYATTAQGKLGYYNIIYTFSRVLDRSTTSYTISTYVYNWSYIHPSNPKARPIYISSDNIYTTAKDKAFVNEIATLLRNKGYTVYTLGIGPNTHTGYIWNYTLPSNAVQLSIFGGADAGVIYDYCTRSFMRTKENRLIFLAYNSNTSVDITNRTWLSRAHDDNYSSSSFTGIAYPDQFLTSHGYGYVYTNTATAIVNALIEYIS